MRSYGSYQIAFTQINHDITKYRVRRNHTVSTAVGWAERAFSR